MSINLLNPIKIFNSTSLEANVTSNELDLAHFVLASISFSWSGTPVGELILEAKNGLSPWIEITDQTYALDGVGGNVMFSLTFLPWHLVRVKYTRQSGTGTIDAWLVGKGW